MRLRGKRKTQIFQPQSFLILATYTVIFLSLILQRRKHSRWMHSKGLKASTSQRKGSSVSNTKHLELRKHHNIWRCLLSHLTLTGGRVTHSLLSGCPAPSAMAWPPVVSICISAWEHIWQLETILSSHRAGWKFWRHKNPREKLSAGHCQKPVCKYPSSLAPWMQLLWRVSHSGLPESPAV